MNGASLLFGVALAITAVAYIARPFRAPLREDPGRSIERWVTATRIRLSPAVSEPDKPAPEGETRFCSQCGRALAPDSRFCSGCGTPVEGRRR